MKKYDTIKFSTFHCISDLLGINCVEKYEEISSLKNQQERKCKRQGHRDNTGSSILG